MPKNAMGSYLGGSDVIYSRKPSLNYIGVGKALDEESFRKHITDTLIASKNCKLEFVFRDVYNLSGDTSKPGRAVNITREQIERLW